jgi:short-subunit dehydrogenase
MTDNPLAVISGATKGIGLAIADSLATEGYDLAVCARSGDDLERMRHSFSVRHPDVTLHTFVVDMSDKSQVSRFAEGVLHIDRPSVLVNNAGVFLPGAVSTEPDNQLERMIDTNLYSAYYLTRGLLPAMLQAPAPVHIFNMCSIASKVAYPNGGSYSISKFALLGFSKVLREELKEHGIKVTAILPGATWSDSWSGVDLPRERLMEAHDIAQALVAALKLSPSAVVEEILIRPQLGDL